MPLGKIFSSQNETKEIVKARKTREFCFFNKMFIFLANKGMELGM